VARMDTSALEAQLREAEAQIAAAQENRVVAQTQVAVKQADYNFAKQQKYPVQGIFNTDAIFSQNAAPYTTQTLCHDQSLPQGTRLFNLSSHTHKHGKHFTVTLPSGDQIYESFVYNDPLSLNLNPPLAFDSPDPAQRVLHYCSFYNNGVADDGSPDPTTVTRASHVPVSARLSGFGNCRPVACVAGKVGAPCNGANDNATCDSSRGAGDGICDACPLTGGESTENEMFILIGSYFLDPTVGAGSGGNAALADLGPPIAARHLGAGPGFIKEDQLSHIQRGLHRLPILPTLAHVFTLLLGGVRGFF